ncbi:hypothetical protein PV08_07555 [Exophiala spinifera]|uniref:SET domain-containing protein n=1 Tax=Exophiala spinifera TaxID=91928 RepID=A0A0D2B7W2_9EURO|nr:uncharacterized protein PV08_07555 [Exophiala spinifera]KIW14770.1 hypothetical protein PV08_07555 [Exophiala spinifera]
MSNHENLTEWALSRGYKLNGIKAHAFAGRGLGVLAERNIEPGEVLMTIPMSAVRTAETLPKKIIESLHSCSNNGLLAVELAQDESSEYAIWRQSLPSMEDFQTLPVTWEEGVAKFLPSKARGVLSKQAAKIQKDWDAVSAGHINISFEEFRYFWLLINTRTFYHTPPKMKLPPVNSDECLAVVPYGDYFNHADIGCKVSYSASSYEITADRRYDRGEEVLISYGSHSNDLLLVEYGFIFDGNRWDETTLDDVVIPLLSEDRKKILQDEGYWLNYHLDRDGACYRTKVAVRLLCMPLRQWRRGLAKGFDDDDRYKRIVNGLLLKVFGNYRSIVRGRLEQISKLTAGVHVQRDILRRRWGQIDAIILAAIEQIKN